jgi:hypothetical protein
MSKGQRFDAHRTVTSGLTPGSQVSRFAPWDGDQYVPYFYNPALDASGERMIFIGNRDGDEQAYLLDLARDEVVQLTDAHGTEQNWSPYIRQQVTGIRPSFIAWAQPGYDKVAYWENNDLCLVDVETFETEVVYRLRDGLAPSVIHCSPGGWLGFGYLPVAMQEKMRAGATVFELDDELTTGCGFCVVDLGSGDLVLDEPTPFWPNHVSASPDHRYVLLCHEGLWELQRMYLYDVAAREIRPLRPQDDGARIGHEFWIDASTVGYHGSTAEGGFFGTIDIASGQAVERRSPRVDTYNYGHYHISPDGQFIVTDGEVTADMLSISLLASDPLAFEPVGAHNWPRSGDQRVHPHPNWHEGGKHITFTCGETTENGEVRTRIALLELP